MESARTRQFVYTWLRVAAHNYADFWQVTGEALLFATTKLKLSLRSDDRTRLMNAYLERDGRSSGWLRRDVD